MMAGPAPFSDGAMLQKIVLGCGTAAIVTVGAWTADTLQSLTEEVAQLRLSMASLVARVDALPPKDLMLRVQILEERHEQMEERLKVIASRVHKRLGIEVEDIP